MANATITEKLITINSRGSLSLPIKFFIDGVQQDISNRPIRFEVDGVPISVMLGPDPNNALGQLLKLTRTQVETLSTDKKLSFAFIDELNLAQDMPEVMWDGQICRIGYKGDPDTDATQ